MPLNRVQLEQQTTSINTAVISPGTRYLTDVAPLDQLNAISTSQGLVLITSNKFDNVTSVSINNCFTSTYQNYRVLLTLTNVLSDADFTLRLRSGGQDSPSNFYDNQFVGLDTANTANNATGTSTAFLMGESDNNSNLPTPISGAKTIRYKLLLDFFSPAELENTVIFGQYTFINKAATVAVVRMGSGQFQFITSFDGFSFISSIANNISGIVRVYGYKI